MFLGKLNEYTWQIDSDKKCKFDFGRQRKTGETQLTKLNDNLSKRTYQV